MATHPVLSGPAVERLNNSKLSKVIVCDRIALSEEKLFNKQLLTRFEWASKVSKDYTF